ncbi:MAG TPA: isocitrate lyase/PEP mutase family protein [Atribacterota bacterium]|nr:isocitrate lyase/PEP mutase family protein [Atribacterota bacterium]HOR41989.1 isocitrate lyase/PEP mutase family protein [Atribacterota bacterium]HPK86460.1 isocitrate lyase/PEP mutase family protein [Atribacterota bacterium]
MKMTTKLRKLFKEKKIIVAPGAHDVLTARIIEQTGFDAVYMTGYGTSASVLGRPDVGLLTMTEMVERARNIADIINIPLIADADTGYGDIINVIRTVRAYEKAGVACIQLEDQVAPKKCGHMLGREIIPAKEMVKKIEAALSTRTDPDFMIMARTDARTNYGYEEAIRRCKLYKQAGADIIFYESPENIEEMEELNKELGDTLTLANMLEKGRTPLLTVTELEKLGYNLVIFCVSSVYVTAKAVKDLMEHLQKNGTTKDLIQDKMIPFEEFNDMIGLNEIKEIEKKYRI